MAIAPARITISVKDTADAFNAELRKQILTAKRTSREVVMTQFKGVMKRVFQFTPPMASGASFIEGRRAGQRTIAKDVAKLFKVIPSSRRYFLLTERGRKALMDIYGPNATPEKLNASLSAFLVLHKQSQGQNKRVAGRPQIPAFATTVKAVYKELLKRQGWVASGWMKGATEAGVKPPAWVSEKNGTGTLDKVSTAEELSFKVINETKHEDYNKIQNNINYAIIGQTNAMKRAFDYYLQQLLK